MSRCTQAQSQKKNRNPIIRKARVDNDRLVRVKIDTRLNSNERLVTISGTQECNQMALYALLSPR
jgi:hypothetical protein